MTNTLKQHLKKLRLSGLLSSLEVRLHEAEANRLPYAEFLELLFQDEINIRHQRLLARRHKSADFREPRSLEVGHSYEFCIQMETSGRIDCGIFASGLEVR
jgi:CRP-like cAMP-binding protein